MKTKHESCHREGIASTDGRDVRPHSLMLQFWFIMLPIGVYGKHIQASRSAVTRQVELRMKRADNRVQRQGGPAARAAARLGGQISLLRRFARPVRTAVLGLLLCQIAASTGSVTGMSASATQPTGSVHERLDDPRSRKGSLLKSDALPARSRSPSAAAAGVRLAGLKTDLILPEIGIAIGTVEDRQAALALWRDLVESHASLLAALRPKLFEAARAGSKVVLWLVAGPFDDRERAARVCTLLERNKRTCALTEYRGSDLTIRPAAATAAPEAHAIGVDGPPALAVPPPLPQ